MVEIVCQSDYQDIYRIKSGVLFVINKFEFCRDENGNVHYIGHSMKRKEYAKGCQDILRILTEDFYDDYYDESYSAGQVTYGGAPVKLVPKDKWQYQIKTTGDLFSGNKEELIDYINEISKIIEND